MAYSADVIVIGAGIGGLTAAALLQEKGFATLTFEKNNYPGGSCASFFHRGYTFDVGASVFYGFAEAERSGTLNLHARIFERLGVSLATIPDPVQIHYHLPDGFEVPVFYERERFLSGLISRFPHEEKGIRAFYQELEAVYDILSALPAGSLEDFVHVLQVGVKNPGKTMALAVKTFKSMGETARKYIKDAELLKFVDIESYSWAVQDAVSTPLVNAGICLADRHHGGINYPVGGSGAIPAGLCEGIRKFGGAVELGCDVEEIVLKNGRAEGVRLSNGEVFTAKAVISNATVWDTFNRLIKKTDYNVPEDRFLRAPSWFQLYLGVDAGAVPEDFHVHHVLVDDWERYQELGGTIYISAPSLLDPSLAPVGKHVVHAFVTDEMDRWDNYKKRGSDYKKAKEAYGDSVVQRTEKILPGLADALEVKLFATPLTSQRYLNRYKGSYGPLLYPGQNVLQKPQNRTSVKDLYAVGDSTFPGQGVIAVTYSGVSCASYVSRQLGEPLEYL